MQRTENLVNTATQNRVNMRRPKDSVEILRKPLDFLS